MTRNKQHRPFHPSGASRNSNDAPEQNQNNVERSIITMMRLVLSVGTISLLAISVAHSAGDAAAGKAKAAACAACHGANGQGVPPNPALVGRSEDDMLQAMKDYKSGKRANAVMKGLTAGLSDQDMANLAAYYASLKK
jgi:cytochrome c553